MGGGVDRREFLRVGLGAFAVAAAPRVAGLERRASDRGLSAARSARVLRTGASLGAGADAPFDHVVVLMFENRSFDHLLGWYAQADGRQRGLRYRDLRGKLRRTFDLGRDLQGCAFGDPAHSWQAGMVHLQGGNADGFLRTDVRHDLFPIGYYSERAVPLLSVLARSYTTLGNYFSSILGATWPNSFYQHAAATDVDESGTWPGDPPGTRGGKSALQTAIWDRVADAGLTGRYYHDSQPFTALFASGKYDAITRPFDEFIDDAKAGALPNVAFVDPNLDDPAELAGTANDFHPFGSMRAGERFLSSVYHALADSPAWDRTVLVVNFDEWGGFFDHVPPPKVIDNNVNPFPGPHPDYTQLGFRVPAIVMSPYAPRRAVTGGNPFEHCSVLRMIEWRWDLPPLSARDANARNLAEVLDFSSRRKAPAVPRLAPKAPKPCRR